jgi:phytoene synthase
MSTTTAQCATPLATQIAGATFEAGNWPPERAYSFCRKIATGHYENFPVGSVLLPAHLRKHFYAIYAFARIADDFADEYHDQSHSEAERLALLDWWQAMLSQTNQNAAEHPVFIALAQTRTEFNLPLSLFEDLLSAFRQDVTVRRYDTFEQLLDYCSRSANPIGRLILLLFGHSDLQFLSHSDEICTALQLTNHWQDVQLDLKKNRVYIPLEDLQQFGLTVDELQAGRCDERFRRLIEFQVSRAMQMFDRGKPLCTAVPGRLGIELRAVWLGGVRILERIRSEGFDVFSNRPRITALDKLRIATRALVKGRRWR